MVTVEKRDSKTFLVKIGGEELLLSPETISPLDNDALNVLKLKIRGAITELEAIKGYYEIDRDAKKVELINQLVNNGISRTQAEKQVKGDETYVNYQKVFVSYQSMIDYLWAIYNYVDYLMNRRIENGSKKQ